MTGCPGDQTPCDAENLGMLRQVHPEHQPENHPNLPQGAPGAFDGAPQPPGIPASRRRMIWLSGGLGILGVVAVLVVVLVQMNGSSDDNAPTSPNSGAASGRYSAEKITDACALIDTSVLGRWHGQVGTPTHEETRDPVDAKAATLRCKVESRRDDAASTGTSGTLRFEGWIAPTAGLVPIGSDARSMYEFSERLAKEKPIGGGESTSGVLSGFGTQAYFQTTRRAGSQIFGADRIFEIGVLDDNLSFTVTLDVADDNPGFDDLRPVVEKQARAVLNELRKK